MVIRFEYKKIKLNIHRLSKKKHKSVQRRLFRMKQSTVYVGFILLSMVVLHAKATSTCSCSCGGHAYDQPKKEEKPAARVKQCTFQNLNDGRDKGQIKTCDFQKVHSNSALRVTYQGGMRMVSCSSGKCCRRWFITINGKECSSPAPIDAVIHTGRGVGSLSLHRPATLDGFCNNILKGRVTVGLSVGNCKNWSHDAGDAYTCWNSVCRFIIEEIPSMQ